MTRDEIIDLLSVVTAYDNRNPSTAMISAWHTAAEVAHWTLGEAYDAVNAHYATSTEFLMPGHVTQRIRAHRPPAAVAEPGGPGAIEATQPASEETRRRVMEQVRELAARRAMPEGVA